MKLQKDVLQMYFYNRVYIYIYIYIYIYMFNCCEYISECHQMKQEYPKKNQSEKKIS